MNKIIYMLNKESITSIPLRWKQFIEKSSIDMNIEIVSIPSLLKSMISIKNNDIVHGHHIKVMFLFLLINIILRKKTIYTVHGSYLFLSKINQLLLKFIFNFSNEICFVNQKLYEVLPKSIKKTIQQKYHIILNGVELDYIYKKIDVYKKYNIKSNDIILFQPARFVEEKNHIRIIEAMSKVVKQDSNIKLILAGDGKLKDNIIQAIARFNLEENVLLIGLISRDEVYNFLERCDLFLMPSISEGLNIAFLEAMSMKSKVLVSNIEQFTYPFKHYNIEAKQYNTYFTNALDSKDIYTCIISVLAEEENLNFNMNLFGLSNMMNKYQNIYNELINDS